MAGLHYGESHTDMVMQGSIGDIPPVIRVPGTTITVVVHGHVGLRPGVYCSGVRDDELSHRLVARFMGAYPDHDTVSRIQAWLMDGGL